MGSVTLIIFDPWKNSTVRGKFFSLGKGSFQLMEAEFDDDLFVFGQFHSFDETDQAFFLRFQFLLFFFLRSSIHLHSLVDALEISFGNYLHLNGMSGTDACFVESLTGSTDKERRCSPDTGGHFITSIE